MPIFDHLEHSALFDSLRTEDPEDDDSDTKDDDSDQDNTRDRKGVIEENPQKRRRVESATQSNTLDLTAADSDDSDRDEN